MHSVVVIHDVSPGSFAKYLGGDKRHTENYAEPIMEFHVWGANFWIPNSCFGNSISFLEFQNFLDKKNQEESLIAFKIPISAKYLGGDKRHAENYAEPIMEF